MTIPTSNRHNWRSGFEGHIAYLLEEAGVDYEYETVKIKYVKPSRIATYTPDFILPNGIIVEAKGQFVTADRQKHLLIREQYPDVDIRIIFGRSTTKIGKRSKTSYGDWCVAKGIKFADKVIPAQWIEEPKKPLGL